MGSLAREDLLHSLESEPIDIGGKLGLVEGILELAVGKSASGFYVSWLDAVEDVADRVEPTLAAAAGEPWSLVRNCGIEEPIHFGKNKFFHYVMYIHRRSSAPKLLLPI
jgi:hypothetical protein